MQITEGDPNVTIGLIDGPIDLNHPAFESSKIKAVRESQMIECKTADSLACRHGTFVSGILCSKRGLSAPAICPGCTLLLRPIFLDKLKLYTKNNTNKYSNTKRGNQDNGLYLPAGSLEELSEAILETVDSGANIINLSLGLSNSSLTFHSKVQEAYDYARKKNVIIVAAAGNLGNIGGLSLIENEWVIPVASCDEFGKLNLFSNIGNSIGTRGLLSPGTNITSTYSGKALYTQMSGTSFAAPFVTGALALLWSIFSKASADQLVYSIRNRNSFKNNIRSIIPKLLNAEDAFYKLRNIHTNS